METECREGSGGERAEWDGPSCYHEEADADADRRLLRVVSPAWTQGRQRPVGGRPAGMLIVGGGALARQTREAPQLGEGSPARRAGPDRRRR